ncbi:MAG: DNA-binding response regulator [Chloroflexi bacterium]|nr:DNA-binding response regulator [Chloroflexota bacterium]MDL1882053.1 response regulator transcription factor [Anaerolineae bacterium CFX8]GIL13430.1 MAG: DNA-binding response regulator [Chloroflexota bacterium]
MTTRVLIVEDDKEMARLLQLDLQRSGYQAVVARNGLEGLRLFHDTKPNLVILDIGLPLMDGMTVCQRIRELSEVPILMMTAHAVTEADIAEGLNLGADEFMLKPLRGVEFHARIKALLRRARLNDDDERERMLVYKDDYLLVDLAAHRVQVSGQEIRLTPTEFKLLATFIKNTGQVLSFQQLLEQVWGPEYTTEHHYPRIYVSHLRRKIEPDIKSPTYIQNEYGIGYRFTGRRVS